MKNIFLIILIFIILTSCEKTVPLDVNQVNARAVIEGQVTDIPGYQYVKVSRTTDFYTTGKAPRVTDATVSVQDDLGNNFSFIHNPNNHSDSVGYYFPQDAFVGEVGRTYNLTVVVDGQTYEASDKLYRIAKIDRLEVQVDEDERDDPEDPGRFFELLLFVKEPRETKDYYLFKSFRNDKLEYASETDVYYADDELIGENIDGIPAPIYYAEGDTARVEVYSLSREAFVFYRDLFKVLNNDGGMFSTPPSDPRSNISNGGLGFFQASDVEIGEMIINP